MKRFFSFFAFLCLLSVLRAFPPAPHHTIEGMVRDELGNPLAGADTRVRFITPNGKVLEAPTSLQTAGAVNYQMLIPMDSGTTDTPYSQYAQTMHVPYQIEVVSGGRTYLPIEVRGVSMQLGEPGKVTRLDLTLGEDADGDGLPDAWEQALMQLAGSLENISGSDDSDGDGLTNLEEYMAGTYAFDQNDGLRLVFKELAEEQMTFEFLGVTGRSYRLMESTDLSQWTQVPFELVGQEGSFNGVYVPSSQMLNIRLPRNNQGHKTYKLVVE